MSQSQNLRHPPSLALEQLAWLSDSAGSQLQKQSQPVSERAKDGWNSSRVRQPRPIAARPLRQLALDPGSDCLRPRQAA